MKLKSLFLSRPQKLTRSLSPSTSAMTSSSSKGSLFEFTRARFLVDEAEQMERRRVRFDIEALGSVAAKAVGAKECVRVERCTDGMFNKAFILTMDDGKEVIGKVPNPNAGIPHFTTASEVATMDFARNVLNTPAPRVYTWNSQTGEYNPVGAEYIIMEKVDGIPLANIWSNLRAPYKLKIMLQIFEYQRRWSAICFPRYGSLYYAKDLDTPQNKSLYTEDGVAVSNPKFAVGPAVGREWSDEGRQSLKSQRGPWNSALDYRLAVGHREIDAVKTLKHFPKQMTMICGPPPFYEPTASKKVAALESYLELLKHILPTDPSLLTGHLWHDDLHHENIFVSPEDPTRIVGIIDWQSVQIAPLFDHWLDPSFIGYDGPDVGENPERPKMPDIIDSLEGAEKTAAIKSHIDESMMVAWRLLVRTKNQPQHRAIRFQYSTSGHLLHVARRVYEIGEAHLAALVLDLKDEWADDCKTESVPKRPEFPLTFSDSRVNEIEQDVKRADLGIETIKLMEQRLGDLWPTKGVIEHESFDEVKGRLRELKLELLSQYYGEGDNSRKAVFEKFWPFED